MADKGSAGLPVDALGNPAIDPTANVIAILEAAVKRQDDLRQMEGEYLREMADLRAKHNQEMRHAEAERIDAIRSVDVQAVAAAAAVASTQASTLAAQVATSAEAMRNQVQAAATAAATALAAALEPIQKDITDLRRVQYEQQGQKAGAMETRVDTRAGSTALWIGLGVLAAWLTAIIGVVVAVTR